MSRIDETMGAFWPRKTFMLIPRPTADELRVLMAMYELTVADVSEIACVHTNTVASWLADRSQTTTFRLMPPRHLSVLRAMLPGWIARRASQQKQAVLLRSEAKPAKKKPASKRAG